MATDQDFTSTTVEFLYANAGVYTNVTTVAKMAAFGTSGAIVSVTINAPSVFPGPAIDAGAYSYMTILSKAGSYQGQPTTTDFYLGYSSTSASSGNKINNASNTTLTTTSSGATYNNPIEGYGAMELSAAAFAQARSINFKGIDNTLVLNVGTQVSTLALNGFAAAGDQVVFEGVGAISPHLLSYAFNATTSTGTLTFSNGAADTTVTLSGLSASTAIGNFSLANAAVAEGGNTQSFIGSLVLSYVPCFLRGTMIDTPFGERAVEDLREGDLVTALVQGVPVPRPVRWAGRGSMDAAHHAFRDAAFPIRIRRDAFADNVPHRDLLVTPEHCLLTEAGLVPARMLVNGASILIDRNVIRYDYFHVELAEHAIILSEGLPSESYLDGENRLHLDRVAAGTRPGVPAAPLAVSRNLVEPVWNALRQRAAALGITAIAAPATALTNDPALRLLLDDGSEIAACRRDAQRHMFQIPRGAQPVRLHSRASVPSEVIGPFVDDRRLLGVAVNGMVLWTGLDPAELEPGGEGWHGQEAAARWTDGNAALDLLPANEDRFLDIHVAGTMPYTLA
ncbi:Hint domain-containing protein [Acetobacteraceae bacterium KSS8]|uniref:Hint domain-containing protein n=1 Tax=Endosaccharibacter trunci TaxID=2812733 RepID=A0ABT1W6Y7_9PROT|nr:Hint domain-containing protein [Acetobacteraceae bacterium KSS8]